MVAHPADYPWSSYQVNGQGGDLITQHRLNMDLGYDEASRHAAYRELFRYQLAPWLIDELRDATHGNYALGNSRFAGEIEMALGRRATPGRAGRPVSGRSEDTDS